METKLKVKLISHTMNPELVIATAGKLCYSPSNIDDLMEKQTDESIERFVNMITSIGHGSVLEHTSFTFGIEGVSRSLTHQLVRHRIASYSQQSQRYVKETQFEYVMPQDIKNNPILEQSYKKHMEDSQRLYDEIVEFVITSGKASASLLQRRFKLGYNRAARIVDLLEERGIIGPANGSKPREVLVKLDDQQ